MNSATVTVGTANDQWDVSTQAVAPMDCPNVGDLCPDGAYYVGLSRDGGVPMFAASSDESGSYERGSYGTSRGATSTVTGQANTTTLAGFGEAAHPAAYQCANSTAHGHSDWYLPAKDELVLFYNGGSPVAGVDTSGTRYWSSTEISSFYAWLQRFSDGVKISHVTKLNSYLVRCVRR